MKNFKKRITSFVIVLTMLLTSVLIVTPTEAAVTYPKKHTAYVDTYNTFDISGIATGDDFDFSSVKSSDTSIVKVTSADSYLYAEEQSYSTSHAYITVKGIKTGKAKVSYKIGSKTYSTTVTVKPQSGSSSGKYTNPIKSITISGVNNGKNLASKVNKTNHATGLKLSKTQDSLKVVVKAKSGWKIDSIREYDWASNESASLEYYSINKSSATVNFGKTTKKNGISHQVTVELKKGSKYQYVYFNFQ